jgi:hypothetical protein
MDADRRSICELTLAYDGLQSKVEDKLLISSVIERNRPKLCM